MADSSRPELCTTRVADFDTTQTVTARLRGHRGLFPKSYAKADQECGARISKGPEEQLSLRGGERIEGPVPYLWRAGGRRHQLRNIAGLGAKLHIVYMILDFVPFLDQNEFVGMDFAPQEANVPKALFQSRCREHIAKQIDACVGQFGLDFPSPVTNTPFDIVLSFRRFAGPALCAATVISAFSAGPVEPLRRRA
jgi:hypothetical protein